MRVDELSMQKLRESHVTIQVLTSQVQDLQERVNCMSDSREYQVENYLTFPFNRQSLQFPRSMCSRVPTRQFTSHARFITDTLSRNSSLNESKCPAGGRPSARGSTWRPVPRGEERIGSTIPMLVFAVRPSTMIRFLLTSGNSTEFFACAAKTANVGASVSWIPHSFNVCMLKDKINNRRDQLRVRISRILKCWTRGSLLFE